MARYSDEYVEQLQRALVQADEDKRQLLELLTLTIREFSGTKDALREIDTKQEELMALLMSDDQQPMWDFRRSTGLS